MYQRRFKNLRVKVATRRNLILNQEINLSRVAEKSLKSLKVKVSMNRVLKKKKFYHHSLNLRSHQNLIQIQNQSQRVNQAKNPNQISPQVKRSPAKFQVKNNLRNKKVRNLRKKSLLRELKQSKAQDLKNRSASQVKGLRKNQVKSQVNKQISHRVNQARDLGKILARRMINQLANLARDLNQVRKRTKSLNKLQVK